MCGRRRKEKPKRRAAQAVRRDGHEPLGLGTEITLLMTERGMVSPAVGGSVLTQFDDVLAAAAAAPELTGHARAADTGRRRWLCLPARWTWTDVITDAIDRLQALPNPG
jgi:hypothetical protein